MSGRPLRLAALSSSGVLSHDSFGRWCVPVVSVAASEVFNSPFLRGRVVAGGNGLHDLTLQVAHQSLCSPVLRAPPPLVPQCVGYYCRRHLALRPGLTLARPVRRRAEEGFGCRSALARPGWRRAVRD